MADAFYELDGNLATPSELTRGPWDKDSQHAGPPAALLGHAMEALPTAEGAEMRIGRITYEVLKPVPIAPLRVEASDRARRPAGADALRLALRR